MPDNMHPLSISPLCHCCLLLYVQAYIFTFKIWFSSLSLFLPYIRTSTRLKWNCGNFANMCFLACLDPNDILILIVAAVCGKLFLWRAKLQTFLRHSIVATHTHGIHVRERGDKSEFANMLKRNKVSINPQPTYTKSFDEWIFVDVGDYHHCHKWSEFNWKICVFAF